MDSQAMWSLFLPSWRFFSDSPISLEILFITHQDSVRVSDFLLENHSRTMRDLFFNPLHNLNLQIHSFCETEISKWESSPAESRKRILNFLRPTINRFQTRYPSRAIKRIEVHVKLIEKGKQTRAAFCILDDQTP